jgi:hypothetical protein
VFEQICISFYLPHLLLFKSMMVKPRLDWSVLSDFTKTITMHMIKMTPLCVLPYAFTQLQQFDPFTGMQDCLPIKDQIRSAVQNSVSTADECMV